MASKRLAFDTATGETTATFPEGNLAAARCLYNWKNSNTRRLQKSLGEAVDGSGVSTHLVIGDSLTSPHTGAGFDFPNSFWRVAKDLLVADGIPNGGTGFVAACDGTTGQDPRISETGTWTKNATYVSSGASNDTITFTSDVAGTAIDVFYHNWSVTFTVSVDGGSGVLVSPDATDSVGVHSVTGLPEGTHTIEVDANAASCLILGFRVRQTSGLEFSNVGVQFGATAIGFYDNVATASPRNITTGVETDPDVVHLCLGANDFGAEGDTVTDIQTALTNIRNLYSSADVILYLEPSFDTDWSEYSTGLYELADALDCPLVDLYRRYGDYDTMNDGGFHGADDVHPTAVFQRDVGGLLFMAIKSVGPTPSTAVVTVDGVQSPTNKDFSDATNTFPDSLYDSRLKYPLHIPAGRLEPIPWMMAHDEVALISDVLYLTMFTMARDETFSNILTYAGDGAGMTASTLCKVGIYEVDTDLSWPADMTCIARSAHDADRWDAEGLKTAAIIDDGAASPSTISSVDLEAGKMYGAGGLVVSPTGAAKVMGRWHNPEMGVHAICWNAGSGFTDLPPTLTEGWASHWGGATWFGLE